MVVFISSFYRRQLRIVQLEKGSLALVHFSLLPVVFLIGLEVDCHCWHLGCVSYEVTQAKLLMSDHGKHKTSSESACTENKWMITGVVQCAFCEVSLIPWLSQALTLKPNCWLTRPACLSSLSQGENPIYKSAVTTVVNPKYEGKWWRKSSMSLQHCMQKNMEGQKRKWKKVEEGKRGEGGLYFVWSLLFVFVVTKW